MRTPSRKRGTKRSPAPQCERTKAASQIRMETAAAQPSASGERNCGRDAGGGEEGGAADVERQVWGLLAVAETKEEP